MAEPTTETVVPVTESETVSTPMSVPPEKKVPTTTTNTTSVPTNTGVDRLAYRHYRTIHPTANKIIAKKWDDRTLEQHRHKLAKCRPGIDNTPPKTYPHMQIKLKKIQMDQERRQQIEHSNKLLLDKMNSIFRMPPAYKTHATPKHVDGGKNSSKRTREWAKIEAENQAIGERLAHRESRSDRHHWQQDRRVHISYLINISAYPQKFMEEEMRLKASQEQQQKSVTKKTTKSVHETKKTIDKKAIDKKSTTVSK